MWGMPVAQRRRRAAALLLLVLIVAVGAAATFRAFEGSAPEPGVSDTRASLGPGLTESLPPVPSAGASGTEGPAETAPVSPTPPATADPVLVGAGDIAVCGGQGAVATARLVERLPGTVFADGDLAYDSGTADEFSKCYDPTWGAFASRTRPVPGNHDWGTGSLSGYLGYWGTGAVGPTGGSWYSFDLGAWHVVVLDADCGRDAVRGCGARSPQLTWLTADLAASSATCTLALWHQPRFSSGQHGDDRAVAPFWDALWAAGAEIVVNGHDHDYERFAPQDPAGRSTEVGIREFVVGTGGAPLRGFRTARANSVTRIATTWGVLALTLHADSYDWRFIGVDEAVLDAGHGVCH